MDSASLQQLAEWSAEHRLLSLALIFLVAFAESIALAGLLVPGALLLFALMAMVALGELSLTAALLAAVSGALAGDGVSFLIGQQYRHRLVNVWPFSRHQQALVRGRVFFARYGALGLIIGRIIGASRPITPLVAGMMGMSWWTFLPVIMLAALLWAPIYLLPGYVFGQSLDIAADVAGRLAMLIALFAGFFLLLRLIVRLVQRGLFSPLVLCLERLWQRAQRRPSVAAYTDWLDDPKQPSRGALGPLLLHFSTMMVAWVSVSWATWHNTAPLNDLISYVLLDWREPWLDRLMLALAGLGHPVVTLSIAVMVGLWLRGRRRFRTAWLWLAGVITGIGLMRAWHITVEAQVSTGWLGLGDAGIVVLLGGYAVLISSQLPQRPRLSSYIWTSLLALTVIAAQIYIGASSVFAAASGVALASAWASAMGIAYRVGHRRHFLARALTRRVQILLVVGLSFGAWWQYENLASRYRIEAQSESISQATWQRPLALPLSALKHPRTQLISSADADDIRQRLKALGFTPLPDFNWAQLFQVLRPDPPLRDLPVLPRSRYGKAPVIAMLRHQAQEALIVRLWQSNAHLDTGQALLVGSLNRQKLGHRGYFFSLREEQAVGETRLRQFARQLSNEQARITPQQPRRDGSWQWLARIDGVTGARPNAEANASIAPDE
jgi:undecaprenyl-diphosphatase